MCCGGAVDVGVVAVMVKAFFVIFVVDSVDAVIEV